MVGNTRGTTDGATLIEKYAQTDSLTTGRARLMLNVMLGPHGSLAEEGGQITLTDTNPGGWNDIAVEVEVPAGTRFMNSKSLEVFGAGTVDFGRNGVMDSGESTLRLSVDAEDARYGFWVKFTHPKK